MGVWLSSPEMMSLELEWVGQVGGVRNGALKGRISRPALPLERLGNL